MILGLIPVGYALHSLQGVDMGIKYAAILKHLPKAYRHRVLFLFLLEQRGKNLFPPHCFLKPIPTG